MELTEADIQPQMTRRRPGQSAITTPRNEKDRVEIQSGTEFGITLGTPIGLRVMNENQRPGDYGNKTMDRFPRPSHADWTYLEKYGVKASSGGGRSSARETIGRWKLSLYKKIGARFGLRYKNIRENCGDLNCDDRDDRIWTQVVCRHCKERERNNYGNPKHVQKCHGGIAEEMERACIYCQRAMRD